MSQKIFSRAAEPWNCVAQKYFGAACLIFRRFRHPCDNSSPDKRDVGLLNTALPALAAASKLIPSFLPLIGKSIPQSVPDCLVIIPSPCLCYESYFYTQCFCKGEKVTRKPSWELSFFCLFLFMNICAQMQVASPRFCRCERFSVAALQREGRSPCAHQSASVSK